MPEFLVRFDILEKIALEYGLRLVNKKNFHEYYSECIKEQHAAKLLETMVTKIEEIHKMTQEQRDQQWEIIGLYCVFMF